LSLFVQRGDIITAFIFFSFWLTVAIYVCAIFSFPTVLLYIYIYLDHWVNWHRTSAEDHTNMSYYNLCGIGSQHINISKGKGEVHIKITGMQDSNSQGRQK
jgi:hypothetical protein